MCGVLFRRKIMSIKRKIAVIICAVLSLVLLFTLTACNGSYSTDSDEIQSETQTVPDSYPALKYTLLDDDTYSVSLGDATEKEINIPSEYNGKAVAQIAKYGFKNSEISSIKIPNSVKSIGDQAFSDGWSLTSVTIGENVTSIGEEAFYNCRRLESIVIPQNVKTIGASAFAKCDSLTIHCEAKTQPSAWDANWNPSNRPVEWGYDE